MTQNIAAISRIKQLLAAKELAKTLANNHKEVNQDESETIVKDSSLGNPVTSDILGNSNDIRQSAVDMDNIHSDTSHVESRVDKVANADIIYNTQQSRAISLALSGKSFCLTGPAGSGKTTTVQGIIEALISSGRCGVFQAVSHKHLPASGVPGIVVTGYTNKAVSNAKKHLSNELRKNCITIHKFLEYEPVDIEVEVKAAPNDPNSRTETKLSRRFIPKRNSANVQPTDITTIIVEEASMVAVDLWNRLIESMPASTHSHLQVIFIGDIQQLPPVFGKSIFIHAMSKNIDTVELTQIYRQALESPIISLAHRILSGKQIPAKDLGEFSIDRQAEGKGKVFIHPRKHKLSDLAAVKQMGLWLPEQIDKGAYDPAEDVILTPYNVNFGTEELNKIVATKYAAMNNSEIWEIYTGIAKVYFRIGERVLHNKSEHIITGIKANKAYYGKKPRPPSATMNYSGIETDRAKFSIDNITEEKEAEIFDYVDSMMNSMADHTSEDNPTARAASHVITVKSTDTEAEFTLSTSGDIGKLSLGYALTVHKSQGSEYRRVFFITHHSQATMIYRELLYTAITRAKEELYIICEPNMFVKGINSQRYPGKTIQEKISSFDKSQKILLNQGSGNVDQLPKDLHRFIPSMLQ